MAADEGIGTADVIAGKFLNLSTAKKGNLWLPFFFVGITIKQQRWRNFSLLVRAGSRGF